MHSIASFLLYYWTYVNASLSIQLFAVSASLLLIGVGAHIWSMAVHLSFLDTLPIRSIEFSPPHFPRLSVITTIFLCAVTLLIVALQAAGNTPPFNGPNEWVLLATFFLITGCAGMLAELRWTGARDGAFAFIAGTSLALLFLVLRRALMEEALLRTVLLLLLLAFSAGLSWWMLYRGWRRDMKIIFIVTFTLWILLTLRG